MIKIVSYRVEWPQEFIQIAGPIRAEMGDLALRIDHIGSTSVPGLAAKDRIDIQVTVAALTPAVEEVLHHCGFERKPKNSADHLPPGQDGNEASWVKWFFSPLDASRAINLHVRIVGYPNQRYPLLFRDYLRNHPEAAEAYARIKRALAVYHAEDVDAYYAIKDPVCDLIIQAAEAWAGETNWQPGASDF